MSYGVHLNNMVNFYETLQAESERSQGYKGEAASGLHLVAG